MRNLEKKSKPQVLEENENNWLTDYKADRSNSTKRYRYRDRQIKDLLKDETGFKCVYCESKIGHNTPGDIEHKIPSSKNIDLHFSWGNLTIACTECNRRKNDYYQEGAEFLDPYVDDVDQLVEHHGPIVYWQAGSTRAEISIRFLELNSENRLPLILRKMEKIEEVSNLFERYQSEQNETLKVLLRKKLIEMTETPSEYSGMVNEVLSKKGLTSQSTRPSLSSAGV
jgi:5-methylcytosine-specific restriction endonuclease McrA